MTQKHAKAANAGEHAAGLEAVTHAARALVLVFRTPRAWASDPAEIAIHEIVERLAETMDRAEVIARLKQVTETHRGVSLLVDELAALLRIPPFAGMEPLTDGAPG